MKLTKDQIEAIRALSAELAAKLEAGESVTLEQPKVWEPNHNAIIAARSSRITNACLDLQAYREEFAPGYEVPPAGEKAYTPMLCADGKYRDTFDKTRVVATIYMPLDVCQTLCDKLNSGEVVL